MATMKFFNVLDVPSEGAVDGTYYVKDGDRVSTYIVSGGKVIPSDVDLSKYAKQEELKLKTNVSLDVKYFQNTAINANTGRAFSETNSISTDFISVINLDTILYSGRSSEATGMAYYDANKEYIGAIFKDIGTVQNYEVTIPSNAFYIRASSRRGIELTIKANLEYIQENNDKRINNISESASNSTNEIVKIKDIYNSELYYSSYNRDESKLSTTVLSKAFTLNTIGDYFEIRARYWGGTTGYSDKLNLVHGTSRNSRFGWYNSTQIWFRVNNEAYKKWDIPENINMTDWNVYRLEVVQAGWELFINGVSMGITASNETSTYKVNDIANPDDKPQKYDVSYFNVTSSIDGELKIGQVALYPGSINVDLLINSDTDSQDDSIVNNPICFVSFNGLDKFKVYMRDENQQDVYYMIPIQLRSSRGTINDPIFFQHLWQITHTGLKCTYDYKTKIMNETTTKLIADGESECVIMYSDENGAKADFTGGVHGDETIDVDNECFVAFYINGIKLSESELIEPFDLKPCNDFYYLQKSAYHDTAIRINDVDTAILADGAGIVDVNDIHNITIDSIDTGIKAYSTNSVMSSSQAKSSVKLSKSENNTWIINEIVRVYEDHPIIAYHIKKTVFKNQSYNTENTLIFNSDREVKQWYHGVCCLAKDCSKIGHNENYLDFEFSGSGSEVLRGLSLRLFEAYNKDKQMSGKIESWITEGQNIINDSDCRLFIADRNPDSKYYRATGSFIPAIDTRLVSEMKVEFNSY